MSKPDKKTPVTLPSCVALAQLRVRQYRQRRHLAGVPVKEPNLLYEAFEAAADLTNYLAMSGEDKLAERAIKLGDAIAKKLVRQQTAAQKAASK